MRRIKLTRDFVLLFFGLMTASATLAADANKTVYLQTLKAYNDCVIEKDCIESKINDAFCPVMCNTQALLINKSHKSAVDDLFKMAKSEKLFEGCPSIVCNLRPPNAYKPKMICESHRCLLR